MARWTSRQAHLRLPGSGVLAEFDFCSFWDATLKSKCSVRNPIKYHIFNIFVKIHQNRVGNRSREYWLRETASGPRGGRASAQPLPHNPRIQRENPAAAGSGECFREAKWRSRRDSNPRDGSPSAPLAGVCLRPLGHSSADGFSEWSVALQGGKRTGARRICGVTIRREPWLGGLDVGFGGSLVPGEQFGQS